MDYSYVIKKKPLRNKANIKEKVSKAFIGLMLISFISVLVYAGLYIKNRVSNSFLIKKIVVVNGSHVNKRDILKQLEKYKNISLLKVECSDIFNKLKKYPWIQDIVIQKNFPNTLVVKVIEETPIAILNKSILTKTGKLIKNYNSSLLNSGLFFITIKNFKKDLVLSIYNKLKTYKISNISEIIIGKDIQIITYSPRRKYILSKEDIDENLNKIKYLSDFDFAKGKVLKEVNLKYKDRIFIKL